MANHSSDEGNSMVAHNPSDVAVVSVSSSAANLDSLLGNDAAVQWTERFLALPAVVRKLTAMGKLKIFYSIPKHFVHGLVLKSEQFVHGSNPMARALMYYGSRPTECMLWSFDYTYKSSKEAHNGCGVAVYLVGTSEMAWNCIQADPNFKTIRQHIYPQNRPGTARFYVDWDQELEAEIEIGDRLRRMHSIIKALLKHFCERLPEKWLRDLVRPVCSFTLRPKKISLHVIFAGIYMGTDLLFRRFHDGFRNSIGGDLQPHIDNSNGRGNTISGRLCMANLRMVACRKAMLPGYLQPLIVEEETCRVVPLSEITYDQFLDRVVWWHDSRGDSPMPVP